MPSILITGATGYFGRHFIRHLRKSEHYERICVYSRDEYKQSLLRDEFGFHNDMRYFVGDVRDANRLKRAMGGVDVVVHAAALKRIEVGHYDPEEMVKTNVIGTMHAVGAAHDAGVETFVFLSSDKAYQPISPYGHSKALAESIVLGANKSHGFSDYKVVRYGNVAGSTGSIIPKILKAKKEETKMTITDPGCTRFWMEPDDAVTLVKDAIDNVSDKQLLIPDHLKSYTLKDLLNVMDCKDYYIKGLPLWEKRHESLNEWLTSSSVSRWMKPEELAERVKAVAQMLEGE